MTPIKKFSSAIGDRMTDMGEHQLSADIIGTRDNADMLRQELTKEIGRLERFSIRGILALSLFMVVSILAWWGFPFLPEPDTVTAFIGKPPPSSVIGITLLLYTFSAIVLSLSRMTAGIEHRSSFTHVGFLTAFFLFYYFGKALEENYWAVFGAGTTILGVESYRIWTFCSEIIDQKKKDIEYVTRTGRPPPLE